MTPPMAQTAATQSTRELIVQAADRLFYERGFESTSFADIADRVKISRGNFYYHFKSKDEILSGVIALRTKRTQAMLDGWTYEVQTPAERLQCFLQMMVRHREDISRFGCSVGTLCAELSKLAHPSQGEAGLIFGQYRCWLRGQFEALGHAKDADTLAMHLLGRSQGLCALAQAFHNEDFVLEEITLLGAWLQTLHIRQAAPAALASL